MAIVEKTWRTGPIQIDITGPEGNAFALMGYARKFAQQLERDPEPILKRMTSGDYEALLAAFDAEFGDFVTLLR